MNFVEKHPGSLKWRAKIVILKFFEVKVMLR